jgi:peroxiredoxin
MRQLLWVTPLLLAAAVFGQSFKLGSPAGEFQVTDVNGNRLSFSELKGQTTVVLFVATKCPVSNGYNERMKAAYRDYSGKGVKFVVINSNSTESASEVAAHAREHGFEFAVYKDPGNVVADLFGATVTPEAFVIAQDGTMVYHGSIDDSLNPERIHTQSLRAALDAAMAGAPVAKAETKAFGCTIKKLHQQGQ